MAKNLKYRCLPAIVAACCHSAFGCATQPSASVKSAGIAPETTAPREAATLDEVPRTELSDVELSPLTPGIWLHRSYADIPPWGRIAANGLLVVGKEEALLVDTPWNDAETAWLFEETKRRFHVSITKVIVTHAHDDNLGGLSEAHRRGAKSYGELCTVEAAKITGKPIPTVGFSSDLLLDAASVTVELFYPGPGHSADNITVFVKEANLLFGGCLIKPADAKTLGNTAEADLDRWSASVDALEVKFPTAEIIVPGHGEAGDRSLFDHTRSLVTAFAKQH